MSEREMKEAIRALLGLGPGDRLEAVGVDGAKQSVGRGQVPSPYRVESGELDPGQVLAALDETRLNRILKSDYTPDLGSLWQSAADPALVYWENAEAAVLRGSPRMLRENDLLFDLLREPAPPLLHLYHEGQEYVAVVSADGVSWARVVRQPSPELQTELELDTDPLPLVEVPSLAELLAGLSCPGWLRDLVEQQLAAEAPLTRAAGPGTLARLWTPGARGEAGALLEELLSGEPPALPFEGVQRWAGALPAEHLELLTALAVDEADALGERLDAIHQAAIREAPGVEALVQNLVSRRDRLASVAHVLTQAGRRGVLDAALGGLDEAADEQLFTLSLAGEPGPPELLAAVRWKEPEAWWGRLAGPRGVPR